MEKAGKRGKIPQSDWPLIMARYDSGETLASIAKTYDCSPPAISYVVSRGRARHPGTAAPATAPSPAATQLIKATAAEPAAIADAKPPAPNGASGNGQLTPAETTAIGPDERRDESWPREANGFARDGAAERNAASPGATQPWPCQRVPGRRSHVPPRSGPGSCRSPCWIARMRWPVRVSRRGSAHGVTR